MRMCWSAVVGGERFGMFAAVVVRCIFFSCKQTLQLRPQRPGLVVVVVVVVDDDDDVGVTGQATRHRS